MTSKDPTSFLMIIGAPKSATTTLTQWLSRHPDMVVSQAKEPRFLTDFGQCEWTGPASKYFMETLARDEPSYFRSFSGNPDAKWAVDASTDYLWCPASPDLIKNWSKRFRTKLICVLRDPIDRAFSEYKHSIRDNHEKESFARSLELEEERFAKHWHPLFYHVRRSRYNASVNRYHELFGDDLLLMDFREFAEPVTCATKITNFLGLDLPIMASMERENASFVYRRPGLARIVKSDLAIKLGRALVPKRFRKSMRAGLDAQLATSYERQEADVRRLRLALADDIGACLANPLIPTDGWTSTFPERQRADQDKVAGSGRIAPSAG